MFNLLFALSTAHASPVFEAAPQLDTFPDLASASFDATSDPDQADDVVFLDTTQPCDAADPMCIDGLRPVARLTAVALPDGTELVRVVDLTAPVPDLFLHVGDGWMQPYSDDGAPSGNPIASQSGGWSAVGSAIWGWITGGGGPDIDIDIDIKIVEVNIINSQNDSSTNTGNDNSSNNDNSTEENDDDEIDDGTDSGAGDGHADGGAGGHP
jgi:hypothetical protein